MKLKIGSKVVPTKKTINWYVAHEGIYARPSQPGTVELIDLSEVCYWRAAKLGHIGTGRIINRSNFSHCFKVEFRSEFGKATAWFEPEDLESAVKYKAPKSL